MARWKIGFIGPLDQVNIFFFALSELKKKSYIYIHFQVPTSDKWILTAYYEKSKTASYHIYLIHTQTKTILFDIYIRILLNSMKITLII